MKKAKKLAALFLAMMMALSIMAVTAAAYGAEEHAHDEACCEETVMPRIPGPPLCDKCNQPMSLAGGSSDYYTYKCYPCGTSTNIPK